MLCKKTQNSCRWFNEISIIF